MPRMIVLVIAGALAGGPLLQPVPAAAQADALLAADRAVAEASARDQFATAVAAALAGDGAILWPGAPVISGADRVRRFLGVQRLLDSLRITWQPLGVELAADGSLGVTWGVAVSARDGTAPQLGRYIAAWRRESGVWKMTALLGLGIAPAASTVLPSGLGPLSLPPLPVSGGAREFIAADLAFARLAGDSSAALAFERHAAPDAFMFGGGLLRRGPDAIRRGLEGGPPSSWSWHPVLAGASGTGDLGYTIGEAVIRTEGAPISYSKYLTIWRRLPDGTVRYLTDGGNSRPAPP